MLAQELLERSRTYLSLNADYELSIDQIHELQEIIREHNVLYYRDSEPIIDDGEWDHLFTILRMNEERLGIFDPASPTRRVEALISTQFTKGLHLAPMISLDNTYNAEEVLDFRGRVMKGLEGVRTTDAKGESSQRAEVAAILELKFDGLGLSLLYREGRLVRALTRGNGFEGEDVTINALEIPSIPRTIDYLGEIEIRGEVVMPHSAFARVNSERLALGDKLFANPRNAASGSLRQLDPLITRSRGLEFYGYSIPRFEDAIVRSELGIELYSESIGLIEKWGFLVSLFFERFASIELLATRVRELATNRPRFGFDIDGLVIKLEDYALWSELGTTGHHPRYAIAYKFPQESVATTILSIEHSVGRTGAVTPVAHMGAVAVGGVMVQRATLHNYEELERKGVRIGDRVYIARAGEVIPEVVSVIATVRTGEEIVIERPVNCPSCGTALTQDAGKVVLYCPNSLLCPAQTSWGLKLFASKHAANIDGLGDKIIDLFIEQGWLSDFVSIYHLHKYRSEILALEGFEERKTDNLLAAIEASRGMELSKFFVALGIPEVGRKTARILADLIDKVIKKQESEIYEHSYWESQVPKDLEVSDGTLSGSSQKLIQALSGTTYDILLSVRDIGPVVAQAIVEYISDNWEMLKSLIEAVNPVLPMSLDSDATIGTLSGQSFCVTGSFEGISRDEIHALIEINGGEVRSSVSAKLSYLIVGTDAGSKMERARELGVQALSLEEWKNKFWV
jgi:DNA ligase (NAD+)